MMFAGRNAQIWIGGVFVSGVTMTAVVDVPVRYVDSAPTRDWPDWREAFRAACEKAHEEHRAFLAARSGPPFGPELRALPVAAPATIKRLRWQARRRRT